MLSRRDLFKVGFLQRCAREGLSEQEMLTRVRRAREKLAGLTDILSTPYNAGVNLASSAVGHLGSALTTGAVLGPLALGGLGGYAVAHATDADETDAEAARKRDYIAQLRQMADQVKQNSELARKRKLQARPYNRT